VQRSEPVAVLARMRGQRHQHDLRHWGWRRYCRRESDRQQPSAHPLAIPHRERPVPAGAAGSTRPFCGIDIGEINANKLTLALARIDLE